MLREKNRPSVKWLFPLLLILVFFSMMSTNIRRSMWYEQMAYNLVSPVSNVLYWVRVSVRDVWEGYLFVSGAAREVKLLREERASLKNGQTRMKELALENERLREILALKQKQGGKGVAARVVGFDPRQEFQTLRIDKGKRAGLKPDWPVVAAGGLVGRLGPVYEGEAIVLLMTDPASFVDAVVQRSRVRALIRGAGVKQSADLKSGFLLSRLEYVKHFSDVKEGDTVVTSGLDGLYPKGISVGLVGPVQNNRYGVFIKAPLLPAVDFSRLEEVLVLPGGE